MICLLWFGVMKAFGENPDNDHVRPPAPFRLDVLERSTASHVFMSSRKHPEAANALWINKHPLVISDLRRASPFPPPKIQAALDIGPTIRDFIGDPKVCELFLYFSPALVMRPYRW